MTNEFNFYDLTCEDDVQKVFFEFENSQMLRYGENPHQKAKIFKNDYCLDYENLTGQELSYNDVLDMNTALSIASEFFDVNCCIFVKHTLPCAVALGKTLKDSFEKAIDCDPVSAINSTVAFTQKVDDVCAKLLSQIQFNIIVAPDFSSNAINILTSGSKHKLVKINTPIKDYKNYLKNDIKVTPFGILIQNANKEDLNKETFKVVTKSKPAQEVAEDLIFAWKVAKHSKSSSVVIAKNLRTLAIVQGQTNSLDSVELALDKACDGSKDAVLASDGILSGQKNILAAVQGRIKAVIHAGGGINDKEIVNTANKYELSVITTGIRQYKH